MVDWKVVDGKTPTVERNVSRQAVAYKTTCTAADSVHHARDKQVTTTVEKINEKVKTGYNDSGEN